MSLYLARSECRRGDWHVITYDISDPDHWIEIDDQRTEQPCAEAPQVTGLRRELYEKLLRPATVGLIAPNGDRITYTLHPNGVNVLQHETAEGEVIQKTCSGKCGKPPNQTTLGPIPCPSGSGLLDCTTSPPTLTCLPVKAGGRGGRSQLAKRKKTVAGRR
jgi:hypothetical protein